eukprot:358232-Chlamydomonas_euryale.AAC.8
MADTPHLHTHARCLLHAVVQRQLSARQQRRRGRVQLGLTQHRLLDRLLPYSEEPAADSGCAKAHWAYTCATGRTVGVHVRNRTD